MWAHAGDRQNSHSRDVISLGIFTSVKDLDKKLMRYIRQYNNDPKPLEWK